MLSNQQIATLLRDAFAEMGTASVKPCHTLSGDVSYGIMGYSQGGGVTCGIANNYASLDLPVPRALFCVTPGGSSNMRNLPTDTKVFILTAENDMDGTKTGAQTIWNAIGHIPFQNKNFVMAMADSKGSLTCGADHSLCLTGQNENNNRMLNALDFYGVWKFSTGIMNYAFKGTDANYCIGTGSDVTYMGLWSNGDPFKPAVVMDSAVTRIGGDIPAAARTVSGIAVVVGRSGIRVASPACALRDIAVFDTRGRLVARQENIFARIATIAGIERFQTVCVRIRSTDNTVTVRKIFYRH
jgi:hypothetical protein